MSSSTANAVEGASAREGLDSLTVFAPGNFDQSKEAYEAGIEPYEAFKKNVAENIIRILDERDVSRNNQAYQNSLE